MVTEMTTMMLDSQDASQVLTNDPAFEPMPIPPAALEKEQARVRSMLEKAKAKK